MRWIWTDDIDKIEGLVRYYFGRRHYAKVDIALGEVGTVEVGNSWPEDVTEFGKENVLQFHNVTYYEAPLFSGHGYYVTRFPPRPVMAQLFREAANQDDRVPNVAPNP